MSPRTPSFELPPVAFIPLGSVPRAHRSADVAPAQVRAAADLPSRLYLGDLDPDSFHMDESGWEARYVDASPGTQVGLSYRSGRDMLVVRQCWRNLPGNSTFCTGRTWKHLAQLANAGFPRQWDTSARDTLEGRYNLRYFPMPEGAPLISGVPDGAFMSVLFPVPVQRLRELVALRLDLECDPAIATPVAIYAFLTWSVVNYVQGRCPDVPEDAEALLAHAWERLGLPPTELPAWETGSDGSRALTLRRLHYMGVVGCAFRELERVLDRLHGHDLLASAGGAQGAGAGAEYGALVLHGGMEAEGARVQFFDAGQTRRLVYGRLTPAQGLAPLVSVRDASYGQAMAFAGEAMRRARSLRGPDRKLH